MKVPLIFAASSFYEILLIVLVLVLIFNGLLRRQVLKKANNKLDQTDFGNNTVKKNKSRTIEGADDEYVDYEIIKD